MNSLTAAFPNQKLHIILDDLNTHKKNEDWLKAHHNVNSFHADKRVLGACPNSGCSTLSESDSSLGYEQVFSALEY